MLTVSSEFPINLECKVVHIIDLGGHTQFIGEVLNMKIDDSLIDSKQKPLAEQIMPLIFAPDSHNYYTVGEEVGKAFSIGKHYKGK